VWTTPEVQQALILETDSVLRELKQVDQLNIVSATRMAAHTYSSVAARKWSNDDGVQNLIQNHFLNSLGNSIL
jgi:hypothetical protein